jgi:hypothetical protein
MILLEHFKFKLKNGNEHKLHYHLFKAMKVSVGNLPNLKLILNINMFQTNKI